MERQKFEDSLKEAFDGAEVAPSDSIWTNVELDLERAAGDKMKRRLLFFQLLAAASMVFAVGVGSIYFLNGPSENSNQLAQNSSTENTNQVKEIVQPNSNSTVQSPIDDDVNSEKLANDEVEKSDALNKQQIPSTFESTENQMLAINSSAVVRKRVRSQDNSSRVKNNHASVVTENVNQEKFLLDKTLMASSNRKYNPQNTNALPTLYQVKNPTIQVIKSEPDPGMLLLARLEDEEKKFRDEKSSSKEKMWASVGFGAGSYNPQGNSSTPPSGVKTLGAVPLGGGKASSSNPTAGSSYSAGLSISGKLTRRFIVQGGLSYLNQNSQFTSSSADGQHASLNEFAATSDKAVATSPYKVSSNLQYLSVPMQAGFIVLDRSFGIQLNGGVSTDLFLQSTLVPTDKTLDKVTQGAGSSSPYRTVNFSGLVGTEFSYKVGDHYRIALNPGLRYALNSIYKPEVDSQASPMTFDVSLRFRYIFR